MGPFSSSPLALFLERNHILDRNVPSNECKGGCRLDGKATLGCDGQEILRASVFLSGCSHSWDTRGPAAFLPRPVHQSAPPSAHRASHAADDNDTVGPLTHAALPTAAPGAQPCTHTRAPGSPVLVKAKHTRSESSARRFSRLIRHVSALWWWKPDACGADVAVLQP